ncbi:nuclear transport factor 2 family protein [Leptolyngbya sp. FACHB-671]|uniref:nuclear transport factor 2 family protein n=1 Tax=Leptolyngbya sp. FACHB-671 TaxID=2692812 RepID=UPI001685DADC|nr:nuclear transport factor 2 family protein [Leptolyngbya sp. FACHB-671]MBD2067061.1 nuclear transport factor 2 family protein [Leptolyngbya sp. FACHB-671]
MKTSQSVVIDRLQQAQNAHDLEAFLDCFAPHIQTDHPVHPERPFQGIEHARRNWSTMFHDIPNFRSESLGSAVEDDTAWAEWYWFSTRRNGTSFGMRKVSILGIQPEQIKWARFYMEPV